MKAEEVQDKHHWDRAHRTRHEALVKERWAEILAFEQEYDSVFADMTSFQPSAIRPILEIVNFKNPVHVRIVEYLKLYQTVTVGRLVGRRMGLLIWDIGQTGTPCLLGAAVLASARFSQRIRDRRLGWSPDFPRTSEKHNSTARAIRVAGLDRIMQLSMACALPPYNILSGAWLAALAPFTATGLDAFTRSLKTPALDVDLAAIVTTTGLAASGAPFRGHRIGQLFPDKGANKVSSAQGARGDIYAQVRPADDLRPIRTSFEFLLSKELREHACELFKLEKPERFASLKSPDRSALAYALRRLRLRRWIFEGNEIGVHLGVIGDATLDYLKSGTPRPGNARPLLDWERAVGIWSRRFLPSPEGVGESASEESKHAHREARLKRLTRAYEFPTEEIRLSARLKMPQVVLGDEG